jgi:hypothetical protein
MGEVGIIPPVPDKTPDDAMVEQAYERKHGHPAPRPIAKRAFAGVLNYLGVAKVSTTGSTRLGHGGFGG